MAKCGYKLNPMTTGKSRKSWLVDGPKTAKKVIKRMRRNNDKAVVRKEIKEIDNG